MEHVVEIISPLSPEVARQHLALYLQKLNYKPTRPTFVKDMEFVRASKVLTMIAVSPRGWKTVIEAQIVPSDTGSLVKAKWKISTAGQICTSLDVRYWKAEIRGARSILEGKVVDEAEVERAHSSALLLALSLLFGAVAVFALALFLLMTVLSLALAALIAGLIVAVGLILMRAPRRLD